MSTASNTTSTSNNGGGEVAIGATLTGGIQDVAALLPLLGTEQCEDQIGSALKDGYLCVAATPISIFGSLGVALMGFKVLIASINSKHWDFVGAKKLKDAGFRPCGAASQLIMFGEDKDCYLAELRLQAMLDDLRIE
ncbi:hypothetical protein BD410DRAFT_730619, partial [Rickenella mellea]